MMNWSFLRAALTHPGTNPIDPKLDMDRENKMIVDKINNYKK